MKGRWHQHCQQVHLHKFYKLTPAFLLVVVRGHPGRNMVLQFCWNFHRTPSGAFFRLENKSQNFMFDATAAMLASEFSLFLLNCPLQYNPLPWNEAPRRRPALLFVQPLRRQVPTAPGTSSISAPSSLQETVICLLYIHLHTNMCGLALIKVWREPFPSAKTQISSTEKYVDEAL